MSFGVGVGDVVSALGLLLKAVKLLSGQAVADFRHLQAVHRDLRGYYEQLRISAPHRDLRQRIKYIRLLLKDFLNTLTDLEPFLGNERNQRPFFSFVAKLAWTVHAGHLSKLQRCIESRLSFAALQHSLRHRTDEVADGFVLEDARGDWIRISLSTVSSWEVIHERLLGITRAGITQDYHYILALKQRRSYVLHNVEPAIDVLCSSPHVRHVRDLIHVGDTVRASVVFPYDEMYRSKCPRCMKERHSRDDGDIWTCTNCPLLLHVRQPVDNQPDPLTQMALDDMRQNSGTMRQFVQDFINEAHPSNPRPSVLPLEMEHAPIESWIKAHRDKIPSLDGIPAASRPCRGLRYVTVCTPQWPDLQNHTAYRAADDKLQAAIEGVKRAIKVLQEEDMPFAWAATLINTRFWFARYHKHLLAFLQSLVAAHTRRKPALAWLPADAVRDYVQRAGATSAEYDPFVVRLRCLLWIYWHALDTDVQVLSRCSLLLDQWSPPVGWERPKTPMLAKLFTLPHMILLPIWWLTWDVAFNVADLFAGKLSAYLPSAIRHIVIHSSTVSLYHYIDGELNEYLKRPRVFDGSLSNEQIADGREWLGSVWASEGRDLNTLNVQRNLCRMMDEGYSFLYGPGS